MARDEGEEAFAEILTVIIYPMYSPLSEFCRRPCIGRDDYKLVTLLYCMSVTLCGIVKLLSLLVPSASII